jgi:hypothetical protein
LLEVAVVLGAGLADVAVELGARDVDYGI